jgi:hypothetical protein
MKPTADSLYSFDHKWGPSIGERIAEVRGLIKAVRRRGKRKLCRKGEALLFQIVQRRRGLLRARIVAAENSDFIMVAFIDADLAGHIGAAERLARLIQARHRHRE